MQATVLYRAHDVRFEDRPDPAIVEPTDAITDFSECRRGLNHKYRFDRRVGFDAPADFDPADIGQVHVEKHELRLYFMSESQRVFPGRGFVYLKTGKP